MAALRKYPDELRERAIRLTLDARGDPASRPGACTRPWSPSHTEEGIENWLHGIPGREGMSTHPIQLSKRDIGIACRDGG